MPKRRLIWQILISYMIVIILAVTAVTIYVANSMKRLYLSETSNDLKARSILFRDQLSTIDFENARMD